VYGAEVLRELNGIIREPGAGNQRRPYRPLIFDGAKRPRTLSIIERGCWCGHGGRKAMAVAGERQSATWRFRRTCGKPRRWSIACTSPTASWATSTRRPSGNGWWPKSPTQPWNVGQYQAKSRSCYATSLNFDGCTTARDRRFVLRVPQDADFRRPGVHRLLQAEGILAVPGSGFGAGVYAAVADDPASDMERSLPGVLRGQIRRGKAEVYRRDAE